MTHTSGKKIDAFVRIIWVLVAVNNHAEPRQGREVKDTPFNEAPIMKMMTRNSARLLCINEADAFFFNDPAIHAGHKGIVLRSWGARPIACLVRGNVHPELIYWNATHPRDPKLGGNIRCSDAILAQMTAWKIRNIRSVRRKCHEDRRS